MVKKTYWKISGPILAMMLATACNGGQDMQEEIPEQPVNGEMNSEDSMGGDAKPEVPAEEETAPEDPANDDMNLEEPSGEEEIPEESNNQ